MCIECIDHGKKGDNNGYARHTVHGRTRLLHRLAYAQANGLDEASVGGVVMHSCDNPRCVNPVHLSLGTQKDNMLDMVSKGRANPPCGERNLRSKLTDAQVLEIREEYIPFSRKHGIRAIARRLGMERDAVSQAIRGLTWSHV